MDQGQQLIRDTLPRKQEGTSKREWLCPINCNGNVLAAVAVVTTGDDRTRDEIVHLAIIPLKPDYEKYPGAPFVDMLLRPEREFAHTSRKCNYQLFNRAKTTGLEKGMAADLLVDWFERLEMGWRKRLVPVSYDYTPTQVLIEDWIGYLNYNHMFHPWHRDVLSAAAVINDICYWRGEEFLFPKMNLGSLASRCGVEYENRNSNAVERALCAAKTYRGMMVLLR